jgi:hypothetical protein
MTVVPPRTLSTSGSALSGATGGALGPVLSMLQSAVQVTIDPGSASPAGPAPHATAGRVSVGAGQGGNVVDLDGGSVSCGPNQQQAPASNGNPSPVPTSSGGPGTGGLTTGNGGSAGTTGTTSTSGETALKSIQTDEGRWTPASDATPLWSGTAAGAAALAGGYLIWRRRRLNRS